MEADGARGGAGIVPGVRRIAVLRANALGDFIFVLPGLEALRAAYPDAEIVLIARDWHRDFLAGRPGPVDRVIALPHGALGDEIGAGEFDADERERVIRSLQEERFDVALQMHGGGRNSNPFLLRLGARVTAGSRTGDAAPLDRWLPYSLLQPEVIRYREIAALVGATDGPLDPSLAVTQRDFAAAISVAPDDDAPLAVLHPGASDPRRRWPSERFAAVGDALAAAGLRVFVTGVEAERELADRVVASMAAGGRSLAGALTLRGLCGLLARCQIVVSNDTGPLHLAAAVETATVGVYWCFNFMNSSPVTRARHAALISWQTHCPSCGADCISGRCRHRDSLVTDVTAAEVVAVALDLLKRGPRRGRET
ncbi:MAG: glycosyltransferase family 9 protein [Chloroflexota bacterium]|nr:glycosyltransferase family 9 protein [Chloroflexota bacterium]